MVSQSEKAKDLASALHADQTDRAGRPYMDHVSTVAGMVDGDEDAMTVAYLHDTLEDTDLDADDLRFAGFSEKVIDAVVCLTKVEGESYGDFIRRLSVNPLARKVKLADLTHNANLQRLQRITSDDIARTRKYLDAIQVLIDK